MSSVIFSPIMPLAYGHSPLICGRHRLALGRPLVMGVVNVTPDSFYDGGRFAEPVAALSRARALLADGADIIDAPGQRGWLERPWCPSEPQLL